MQAGLEVSQNLKFRMAFSQFLAVFHALFDSIGLPGNFLVILTIFLERRLHKMRYFLVATATKVSLYRVYSILFNPPSWRTFLELNSKGLYYIEVEEKKESRCLVLTSSLKREIRYFIFHFVDVQRRQRNVGKSVMQLQSCCFANLYHIAFLPF